MKLTTWNADMKFAAAFPQLVPRTAVRLHPRRGAPSTSESHIGGPLLWPEGETWPACTEHSASLVPVLQLRSADVPELPFPTTADIFQVLWCPFDHEADGYGPRAEIRWRARGEVGAIGGAPPAPPTTFDYIPRPCKLAPERVVDFPNPHELDLELSAALDRHCAHHVEELLSDNALPVPFDPLANFYQYSWSSAPGCKVGGWPEWVQDPKHPSCVTCDEPMDHLLTMASAEFDGGSWWRWMPIEQRHLWGSRDLDARLEAQRAPDLMFGDMGNVFLFTCACNRSQVSSVFQCS